GWLDLENRALGWCGDGADGGQAELVDLLALDSESPHAQSAVRDGERERVRRLSPAEERRDLWRHLPGLGAECLAPAEDEVCALLLDRHGQRPRGAQRVGDREQPVGEMDAA